MYQEAFSGRMLKWAVAWGLAIRVRQGDPIWVGRRVEQKADDVGVLALDCRQQRGCRRLAANGVGGGAPRLCAEYCAYSGCVSLGDRFEQLCSRATTRCSSHAAPARPAG